MDELLFNEQQPGKNTGLVVLISRLESTFIPNESTLVNCLAPLALSILIGKMAVGTHSLPTARSLSGSNEKRCVRIFIKHKGLHKILVNLIRCVVP